MSVEDKNVIDFVSIDSPNKKVILTISDHLEWGEENEHLLILQDKINTYLGAIENGELFEKYPKSKDKDFVIEIIAKYEPNNDGYNFLNQVRGILEEAGYDFVFKQLDA